MIIVTSDPMNTAAVYDIIRKKLEIYPVAILMVQISHPAPSE